MRLYTPGKFREAAIIALIIIGLFGYAVSVVDRTAERNADGKLEIADKEVIIEQIKEDAADADAAVKEAYENRVADYSNFND